MKQFLLKTRPMSENWSEIEAYEQLENNAIRLICTVGEVSISGVKWNEVSLEKTWFYIQAIAQLQEKYIEQLKTINNLKIEL